MIERKSRGRGRGKRLRRQHSGVLTESSLLISFRHLYPNNTKKTKTNVNDNNRRDSLSLSLSLSLSPRFFEIFRETLRTLADYLYILGSDYLYIYTFCTWPLVCHSHTETSTTTHTRTHKQKEERERCEEDFLCTQDMLAYHHY